MICEHIKNLRESRSLTQAELAKKLGVTRAAVNAWEMGISTPSTAYLVELADFFGVSVDYLLGQQRNAQLDISGLPPEDVDVIYRLITLLRSKDHT